MKSANILLGDIMQINKFKKVGKSKYKIFFDNTDITLYEDIILKYDLLLKKEIDVDLLDGLTSKELGEYVNKK